MKTLYVLLSFLIFNPVYAIELSPDNLVNVDSVYPKSNGTVVKMVNKFGVRYGLPSEQQILPISTMEMFWQIDLPRVPKTLLMPLAELGVSKLIVDDKHGVIWSAGLAYKVPILNTNNRLSFEGATKINLLSRHDFGRKRYGGPLHFSYRFGVAFALVQNINLSYSWQHMSNADLYDYNPTLETHTVALVLSF
ncbi:MAG: acyloxyacyl hydrolase [Saccharospirillaceae bacterium]|nr:acyloxyacyl hydrolase [Pseudomonadales bacterium]NRB79819.1 acyloxyacyl hydrolase [Saccharospirillaceae bacterium]